MNAQQPGYWAGLLLGGAGAGAIAGLVPLFLGVRQGKTWLAVGGFLASVAAGLATGILGAAILAGIFSVLIRPWEQPATGAMPMSSSSSSKRGSALGWYLVLMFFGQTVFMAVFWSLGLSLVMRKSLVSVLVPSGAGFGLTMGIFMTALMAVLLRAGSVRVRVLDRADFLNRLDRAAAKLRYRLIQKSDGSVVYEPKTPLRTTATRVFVELGADDARVTGPNQILNRLKTEIENP
jgi:hypothetical protein